MGSIGFVEERDLLRMTTEESAGVLERALLALSGLRAEPDVIVYEQRIDQILDRFWQRHAALKPMGHSIAPAYRHREIAEALFEYLWTSKPNRFGESIHLTDAVDAQLDPGPHRTVGNCVGLTSLYSVLGSRVGLRLSLLVSPDHMLSRLRAGDRILDLDHTDPLGFDCSRASCFREFRLAMLTASVLNGRGLKKERAGCRAAARSDYEEALRVNPGYANAYNNRGNMRFAEGDLTGAIADYTKALRLEPEFAEAICNRGIARQRLGHLEAARADYERALRVSPHYADARRCLDVVVDLERGGASFGRDCRETA